MATSRSCSATATGRRARTALSGIGHAVCSPAFRDAHARRAGRTPAGPAAAACAADAPERWLSWSGWFDAHGLDTAAAARGVTFNSYALVIHAALLGEGVALGWSPLVDELVASGQLVKLVDAPVVTSRGYFLVRPPQRRAGRDPRVPALAARRVRERVTGAPRPRAGAPIPATRRVGSIRPEIVLIYLSLPLPARRGAFVRRRTAVRPCHPRSLMTAEHRPDQFVLTLSCASAAGRRRRRLSRSPSLLCRCAERVRRRSQQPLLRALRLSSDG